MGAIADKRLGDFLPTIDAYRPVAITVAAILGLVMVVPGAAGDDPSPADFTSTPASDADDLAVAPSGDDLDAGDDEAPGAAVPAPAPRPSLGAVPTRSSPAVTPAPPRASAPSGGAGSGSRTPAVVSGPGTDRPDLEPAESQSLRIAASGWASSTGGSPLPVDTAEDVPDGTLPVGTRIGQTDKVSFFRLTGDATTLVLGEDADGRRGNAFEAPPVQLCRITDGGWETGEDQAMADAPAHDPDACIAGQQGAGGTWSFSLALFDDPADPAGFALVPTAEAPLDFQITFAGQALE